VWRFSTRKLSTEILIAQLAILTATVLIGFVLFARAERAQLDHQYEQRAGAIAQTVAGVPDVQACRASAAGAGNRSRPLRAGSSTRRVRPTSSSST
jgi:sensor histidine kinase regulating citrate/malate metabolism